VLLYDIWYYLTTFLFSFDKSVCLFWRIRNILFFKCLKDILSRCFSKSTWYCYRDWRLDVFCPWLCRWTSRQPMDQRQSRCPERPSDSRRGHDFREFLIDSIIIRGSLCCFLELGTKIFDIGILFYVQGVDIRKMRSKVGRKEKIWLGVHDVPEDGSMKK